MKTLTETLTESLNESVASKALTKFNAFLKIDKPSDEAAHEWLNKQKLSLDDLREFYKLYMKISGAQSKDMKGVDDMSQEQIYTKLSGKGLKGVSI